MTTTTEHPHHWVIEDGLGVCKICGDERLFDTHWHEDQFIKWSHGKAVALRRQAIA